MSQPDSGRPAFPLPITYHPHAGLVTTADVAGGDHKNGVTVREYFAARAPHEPQAWFKPVLPPPPEPPPDENAPGWGFTEEAKEYAGRWRRNPHLEFSNDEFVSTWRIFWQKRSEHQAACDRLRLIQWPWAWADAVLEAAGRSADR